MGDFDENYYINKLEESQKSLLVLGKRVYVHPKEKYVKGYMLDGFYTVEEYKKMLQKGMPEKASPYLI